MLMVMDMSTGKPVEDEFGAVTNIGSIGASLADAYWYHPALRSPESAR